MMPLFWTVARGCAIALLLGSMSVSVLKSAPSMLELRAMSLVTQTASPVRAAAGFSAGASADASVRRLAFVSDAVDLVSSIGIRTGTDVYVRDLTNQVTLLGSVAVDGIHRGSAPSWAASLSSDGQTLMFLSEATNLVADGVLEGRGEAALFRRDLARGVTTRVSPVGQGLGPVDSFEMAADGRSMVYQRRVFSDSDAGPVSAVASFWADLATGDITPLRAAEENETLQGCVADPTLTTLCFRGALRKMTVASGSVPTDLMILRRAEDRAKRVMLPVGADGISGVVPVVNVAVSGNGSVVVFRTAPPGTNSLDADGVWRLVVATGAVTRISGEGKANREGADDLTGPVVSRDGSVVAFQSTGLSTEGSQGALRVWTDGRGLESLSQRAVGGAAFEPAAASEPVLSRDGSMLAYFSSEAHPGVGASAAGSARIYVRNLNTGSTVALGEVEAAGLLNLQISADQSWVLYEPQVPIPGMQDLNGSMDVVVAAVDGSVQRLVSVADPGVTSVVGNRASRLSSGYGAISDDGTRVAFVTDASDVVGGETRGATEAVVRDLVTGRAIPVGRRPDGSLDSETQTQLVLSGDGSHAAFLSRSGNLLPGNTNLAMRVYVRNLDTGVLELASVDDGPNVIGSTPPSSLRLSRNGRRVLFDYQGYVLWPFPGPAITVMLRDLDTHRSLKIFGTVERALYLEGSARISADGMTVALSASDQAYVYRLPDLTPRPLFPDPGARNGVIGVDLSADGSRIAIGGLRQSYVAWYDVEGRVLHPILSTNAPIGSVSEVRISQNGQRVLYAGTVSPSGAVSASGNIGIWVYDIPTARFIPVGLSTNGVMSAGSVDHPSMSADGRWVTFRARADDLVPGDANQSSDVFVQDIDLGIVTLVSRSPMTGRSGSLLSAQPQINANGSRVVFDSFASDLIPGDLNLAEDVFVARVPRWFEPEVSLAARASAMIVQWKVPPGMDSMLERADSLDAAAVWNEVSDGPAEIPDPAGTIVSRAFLPKGVGGFLRVRSR